MKFLEYRLVTWIKIKLNKIILGTTLLFVLMSCSSRNSVKLPDGVRNLDNLKTYSLKVQADTVHLKPVQTFGNNSDKQLIGHIGDIAIDKNNRVFITDYDKQMIDIFRPNGTYSTHIARRGKGPGEFMRMGNMKIVNDKLYVYDYKKLKKISVFSLNSRKLIKEWIVKPLNGMVNGAPFYILNDSALIISLIDADYLKTPRYIHFYIFKGNRFNPSNELFKKRYKSLFSIHSGGMAFTGYKPGSRSTLAVKGNRDIYTAWTGRFLIKIYSLEGDYTRAFYYPFKKLPFDESKYLEKNPPKVRPALRKLTYPKTWPALYSMKIDSHNRLWVSTIVKNPKVYQWWLLTTQGKLIARFTWPRDKPIEVIKNGYVYTIEKNRKGVQRVVKYKIKME